MNRLFVYILCIEILSSWSITSIPSVVSLFLFTTISLYYFAIEFQMLMMVPICCFRESEIDIEFAQDAINEYKVLYRFICAFIGLSCMFQIFFLDISVEMFVNLAIDALICWGCLLMLLVPVLYRERLDPFHAWDLHLFICTM